VNATGPPEKGEAALRHAATPKLFNSQQSNSDVAIAQHDVCAHKFTVTQQEPPGRTHYSREICIQCGRHLRWLPRSANVERRKPNSFRLARLGMCEGLSKGERNFVCDISQRQRISPRQHEILAELCTKYLEGKAQ
jgi:hypothetical protein